MAFDMCIQESTVEQRENSEGFSHAEDQILGEKNDAYRHTVGQKEILA